MRKAIPVFLFALVMAAGIPAAAQGHFEFGFHYGSWSLNLLKPTFESLADSFAEQIKNDMLDTIREDNPARTIEERGFRNSVDFDSSGNNFGFEVRWYPAGQKGSFSIGLSMEKTKMKFGMSRVHTELDLMDMGTGESIGFLADSTASVESHPLAFMLSFRWDILPSKRINPYFTFGLGMAGVSAWDETRLSYDFQGILSIPGEPPQSITESSSKTLLQIKQEDAQRKKDEGSTEEPFDYPINFFPFLQLHFGIKGRITNFLHVLADFGIYDGFVLRAGLAVRV